MDIVLSYNHYVFIVAVRNRSYECPLTVILTTEKPGLLI